MHAAASIGLPEARIPLAQATIHLACAAKSNAVVRAINAAQADVRGGRIGSVPRHLSSSAPHTGGDKYRYPHDDPAGVITQEYAPAPVRDRVYYQPTDRGAESRVRSVLDRLRSVVRGTGGG
jgi:putative ATPase